MAINPGNIAFGMPPAEDDQVRKQRDLERTTRENAAARSLAASQIGNGGVLQVDGSLNINGAAAVAGSLTVSGTLSVPAGSLNTASSISAGTTLSAGTTISAGGAITGASVAATGAVSGATVAATGAVSGTTGTFNSGLYSTDARNFVVVTNYAAGWIDVNGHFGISPSTERFKKDIVPWIEANPEAVFGIVPVKYRLRIPDRWMPIVDEQGEPVIDPDTGKQALRLIEGFEDAPDAKERIGFIAERLVEAGFEEAVVYDEAGLPVSINYAEWVVPLQMGMRWLHSEMAKQKSQIEDLTLRLNTAGI